MIIIIAAVVVSTSMWQINVNFFKQSSRKEVFKPLVSSILLVWLFLGSRHICSGSLCVLPDSEKAPAELAASRKPKSRLQNFTTAPCSAIQQTNCAGYVSVWTAWRMARWSVPLWPRGNDIRVFVGSPTNPAPTRSPVVQSWRWCSAALFEYSTCTHYRKPQHYTWQQW